MRRHELPLTFLFYPHVGRLKLTAVRLIVFFAAPGRKHSHQGSVPAEKYFYFIVTNRGLRLGGLSSRFLTASRWALLDALPFGNVKTRSLLHRRSRTTASSLTSASDN